MTVSGFCCVTTSTSSCPTGSGGSSSYVACANATAGRVKFLADNLSFKNESAAEQGLGMWRNVNNVYEIDSFHFVTVDLQSVFANQPPGAGAAGVSLVFTSVKGGSAFLLAACSPTPAPGAFQTVPAACAQVAADVVECTLASPAGYDCPLLHVLPTAGDVLLQAVKYKGCEGGSALFPRTLRSASLAWRAPCVCI